VGAKVRQWSQISHRKLKISISHGVVILASEPDAMSHFRTKESVKNARRHFCRRPPSTTTIPQMNPKRISEEPNNKPLTTYIVLIYLKI
jgi:hypothetical protein